MSRKALGSLALVLAAVACSACSAAGGPPAADPHEDGQPKAVGIPGNPRFFQVSSDDTYWITHDTSHDRVLSSGARLELSSTGEVLASAWETDKATAGDVLAGGLAVAPHLGGGYLFWSQSRVFRATDFTGPLVPISLGLADPTDVNIRGLRNGLRSVMIATDAGPRALSPGATSAVAFPDPGVTDLAALDGSRALRVDAFGRTAWTIDGGKTWNDALQIVGTGVRNLAVSPDELWFETNNGRAVLGREGPLAEPDGPSYRYVDYQRPFQVVFKGTRADRDDQYSPSYREYQPLQAAIASGVRFPDGSGFGVLRGAVVRVDLTTGKILSLATDWLPNGLECQPTQMGASILFACASEDYQSSGTYVLRSDGQEPPKVERLFTDDGAFISDDAGGFGFTGSCKAEPKFVDPDRYYGRYGGRYGYDGEEDPATQVQAVMCVRRSADDWVERRLELDADTQLVAWIPRRDGTAVALVRGTGRGEALPDLAVDSQRETSQNGVRVVRLFREVEGWSWSPQQVRTYYSRNQGQQLIDRRYRALDDGSIVGWLATSEMEDRYTPVARWAGAVLRPGGRTEIFELPATPVAMATGGPFGLLTTREGKLFETTDRGRSWRAAGRTALTPTTMQGTCTIEGCALSTGARAGWGTSAMTPQVNEEKREELPKPKTVTPVLVCEPQGMPKAEESTTSPAAATLGSQAKVSIQTTFGATLEMIRETPDALSSASPYSRYGYPPPPPVATAAPSASAAASSKAKAKAAPTRTHTLVLRPPLDPLAPIARLNATNATLGYRNRGVAIPLLGPGLDVSFLFYADQTEALADRNDIVTMPQFDTRRYYYYYGDNTGVAPGIRTANAKATLLGDNRRRSALEEHGYSPQKPAFYFAFDREVNRRRGLTLGRRDDGGTGILVLDSAAPEMVGVAPFDRVATTLGDITKLAAWSTIVTADDPVCRADKKGYRAIVPVDPALWFTLDATALPGVTLAKQGIALVRWSEERVCLEAIDVAVNDPRRRPDAATGENLVIRWGPSPTAKAPSKEVALPAGKTVGALRSLELMQPLACSLERPATAAAK